jgi:hypothetical protein
VGHTFIRKIHALYQRVLRKYPGNVGLWLDFATFCYSHGNSRLLSEVVSQGLLLNPSCAGLWCFAANWEYKHKGDISAARHLLLRGLRNCGQSKVLWQVYFRLELKYASDVQQRNRVLGIDAVKPGERYGAVAETVFEAACRVHPGDEVFHMQFVYIASQYEWAESLRENMIKMATSGFANGANAENDEIDLALYERLLMSLGKNEFTSEQCGALVSYAVEAAVARGSTAPDRIENLLVFLRDVFKLDERAALGSDVTNDSPLDRLGDALSAASEGLLASDQRCAALGFDSIREAMVVTSWNVKNEKKKGARVFLDVLTGKSLPADVRVCRDSSVEGEKETVPETAATEKDDRTALEDEVFAMVSRT